MLSSNAIGNMTSGSIVYMIARHRDKFYSFARIFDGIQLRERDVWLSESPLRDPSQVVGTPKFYKFKVSGGLSPQIDPILDGVTVGVSPFNNKQVVLMGNYQVPQPKAQTESSLWFGVWYDVHTRTSTGEPSVVSGATTLATPAGVTGFAGVAELECLQGLANYNVPLQVTFVPIGTVSMYHEGVCSLVREPMTMFTKTPVGCDDLTRDSKWCLFSDLSCNNSIGFRLAGSSEKCGGRVYGPCDDGECAYINDKFACAAPAPAAGESGARAAASVDEEPWYPWYGIFFFVVLVVVGLLYIAWTRLN